MLEKKLSPDAICGFVSKHKLFDKTVCSKTLYNYIDKCLLKVRNIDLALKVKLHTSKRKNRKNKKILGKSIEERSDIINNRIEFGHWEIDTIVGTSSKSAVLLALDERTTRMRIMLKIKSKTAEEVNKNLKKIIEEYKELAPAVFKSITSDKGSEFAKLREVAKYIDIYYAHPFIVRERNK